MHRDRGRRRGRPLARPRSLGRRGRGSDSGQPGQHQRARRHGACHQCRLPRGRHQQRSRAAGLRRGQGVQRAGVCHPPLREPDQRRRRDPWPQDQPDHRQLRPRQRHRDAFALPTMDAGQPARVRRHRRDRHLDRGQRALRDPGGAHADDRGVDDDHQLDRPGFSLSLVDRGRPGTGAEGHRAMGSRLGPARQGQEGGHRRVGPVRRPGRAAFLSVCPTSRRSGSPRRSSPLRPVSTRRRAPTPTRSWPWSASSRPACSR